MTTIPPRSLPSSKGARRTAVVCVAVVFSMVGLSFAAVPLYRLLCQMTGFGGTPMVGAGPAGRIVDRTIAVRLDANVGAGSPWRFRPDVPEIETRLGETRTVFYRITNAANYPTTGIATFNVEPPQVGGYFVKIQCFCFAETTLRAGETIEAPVAFYVDPALADVPELRGLSSITLSYTVFPAKDGLPLAATASTEKPKL